jgi:putative polymerase
MTRQRTIDLSPLAAITVVVTASLYTAALCLINTRVTGISNTHVAIVDGVILAVALLLALKHASPWSRMLLAALAGNFLVLVLLSGAFEPKAVRDPLVLIAFVLLGLRYGGFTRARVTFFIVSAIVLTVALIEFFAPDFYTSVFNVIDFYRVRGMVDAETLAGLDSAFFLSGARDDGRMLAPFLGEHRVSSIFLEPVSMGNFGAIALMFALSIDREHWRTAAAAGAIGIVTIVLSDARFGSLAAMLFMLVRLLPLSWMRIGLPLLPLIAIAVLVAFAWSDVRVGDDLPTRLAASGRVLLSMEPAAIFGLGNYEITTYDAGYAYALSAFGLPFCVLLWASFVMLPVSSRTGQRFKVLLGVYVCALLCISGTSLFALKTAGLTFFLAGALAAPRGAPAYLAQSAIGLRQPRGAPA